MTKANNTAATNNVGEALSIEKRGDVAILWMDVPGEPVNTLNARFATDFAEAFGALEADTEIKAVVFASAKKSGFIAGADVKMLDAATSKSDAVKMSRDGQQAMDRIERFKKPVVAAIHGPCLGGGLEVALACHGRVASESKKTKLGLPECQLGLLPGAGGTQRLPRLIGVQGALDLMLTGKQVNARKAKKLELVDEVVPEAILVDVAITHARKLVSEGHPKQAPSFFDKLQETFSDTDELTNAALTGNPLGRKVLFDQARSALHKKTRGLYPAQDRILDVVKVGLERGFREGLEAEAKHFGELVMSEESKALRSIFFATTAMKKDNGVDDKNVEAREVRKVGMLGAGLMGAGIAYITSSRAKTRVRLKDRDSKGVLSGLRYVRDIVDKGVKRRKVTKQAAEDLMLRIGGTTDYSGFGDADVVIEAVFEDLDLKHRVLKETEAATSDETIFASNTSSIPITKIAEASAHPETVIGMHYFSPVHKMPLLEIITTDMTSPWVTATCVALGKAQGKTVIVVRDGVGFYTTRILAPMMNEAAHILAEGVAIDRIDEALMDFGFPVGPMKLTDEVGIDVGQKVGKIMLEAFGDRMSPPAGMEKLVADDRKGRKNGRGFYKYDGDKSQGVDESIYEVLGVKPTNTTLSNDEIAWRCTLQMVNEAALCFGEGILRSARDGDIGAIFGLGFPPFRGGPFRFVDHYGAKDIVRRMRNFEERYGARFAPAPILVGLAEAGGSFHGKDAVSPGTHRA